MMIQDLKKRIEDNMELTEIINAIYTIGLKPTEEVKELLETSCELTRLVAAYLKKEEKDVFEKVCTLLAHPDVIEEYGDLAIPFLEHRIERGTITEDEDEDEDDDPFEEDGEDEDEDEERRYRGFRMIEEIHNSLRSVDTCSILTLAVASASLVMSMANLFYTLKKDDCVIEHVSYLVPNQDTWPFHPWNDY